MPPGHPDRVFVLTKCLVARAYLNDDLIDAYDDHECDHAARILLGLTEPPHDDVAPTPHPKGGRRRRRGWPRMSRFDERGPA